MLSKLKGTKMHPPFEVGACTTCHVPHASANAKLVTTKGSELCLTCHSNVLGGKNIKSTHLPAKENCAGCHDPHGSTAKTQLKKDPPELCLGCHTKLADVMRKPGAKIHPPAAMGQCTFCHKPHEAVDVKLLTSSPPGLCVTCHNTANEKIVAAHGGMQVKETNCVGCHEPHAAEGSKLFHPVQHKPFAGAVCTACHKK
jgi:predicted CXXCH cytochrome family protein